MSGPRLSKPALVVDHPGWLTAVIMLATVMQVLDITIANVALPHMAASLNASQDEITWVLTSYIVSSAVATPLTGWVSERFGRQAVLLTAIMGFTLSSLACGTATGLPEMVIFRVVQGAFGAVVIPLAQAVILDINPREKFGQAMAIYGAGIMVGPIIGPTLGGYLTEYFNWRYVFLINLPLGLIALTGVWAFMPGGRTKSRPFDFFGFAMLALAIGALQMILDRGEKLDWLQSPEIWIYMFLSVCGFWVFIVHCWTAEHPFIDLHIFRDRNFSVGLIFIFLVGLTLFSGLALLPPLLQGLMGYPVETTGLVMAPRGVGTMVSMILVGRLVARFDARILVAVGLSITSVSLWMMSGFDLQMGSWPIISSGVVQGFGLGFVFVPLSTLTFATLEPAFRGIGTALFSLVRNVGSSIGISIVTTVLSRMVSINQQELSAHLTATSPEVAKQVPGLLHQSPLLASIMNGLISQQAAMIAYLDDFLLMLAITLAGLPIVFLLRRPPKHDDGGGPPAAATAE